MYGGYTLGTFGDGECNYMLLVLCMLWLLLESSYSATITSDIKCRDTEKKFINEQCYNGDAVGVTLERSKDYDSQIAEMTFH